MYYLIHQATTKKREDIKRDILKTLQMYQNWDAKKNIQTKESQEKKYQRK